MYIHRDFHVRISHDSYLPFYSNWSEVGVSRHIGTGGACGEFAVCLADFANLFSIEKCIILTSRLRRFRCVLAWRLMAVTLSRAQPAYN